MNNLMTSPDCNGTILGRPQNQVVARLDALLLILKDCKEETCTHPWRALHPDHTVATLTDALNRRYDEFYEQLPEVQFEMCNPGYMPEIEGPIYGVDSPGEDGYDWSFWE